MSAAFERFFFGEARPHRLALCRALLGAGLLVYYLSCGRHVAGRFGELPGQPFAAWALYLSALAAAAALVRGWKPWAAAAVSLLLYCLFRGGGSPAFGWGRMVPVLLGVIAASSALGADRKAWPLRLIQLSVCGFYAWNAWGQLHEAPWLDPSVTSRLIGAAPLGRMLSSARSGFVPIVEITGCLAWLCQLAAPALLWRRAGGRYLAAGLIVLHGCLEVFTPPAYWNFAMIVALVAFLPDEWLTLRRRDWIPQLPALRLAFRRLALGWLLTVMLFTIFERNFVQQFDLYDRLDRHPWVQRGYEVVTTPFVDMGVLILFNSIWRMYSPTWKEVVWVEWYQKYPDGAVERWPQQNFSPEYRMERRTWLQAIWTDFKREKVGVGELWSDRERTAYGKFLCWDILSKTGAKPVSVHPEVFSFKIRGPEEDWSLLKQGYERKDTYAEVPCD